MNDQASLEDYRRDLAERARDTGAAAALWNADEWSTAATLVLDELIERGYPFTSEDIRLVTGPPPSPGAFGALFLKASRAGRIRAVGILQSKRPARRGGLVRQWVGSPEREP
jgi:hypothetical protein